MQGGYGSDPENYGNFSPSAGTAPVLVPGHDRPFQFQHWMSWTLRRDRDIDFKVFIDNLGLSTGTFSCGDDKLLPPDDYVVGTLLYKEKPPDVMEKLNAVAGQMRMRGVYRRTWAQTTNN